MAKITNGGLPTDLITKAVITTSIEHHEIHEGDFYESTIIMTLPTGTTNRISLVTADKEVHYRNEKIATSADKVIIGLLENSTISGGVLTSLINHNRLSLKTSSVIMKTAISLSTAGTTISTAFIGGGTNVGGNRVGAALSEGNEFILKKNATYCIQVHNSSSETNIVFLAARWYEL